MAFSSPCSGNYVKQNEKVLRKVRQAIQVFVPLFGELCKTGPHRGIYVSRCTRVFVPLFGELCKTVGSAHQIKNLEGESFRPLVRGTM